MTLLGRWRGFQFARAGPLQLLDHVSATPGRARGIGISSLKREGSNRGRSAGGQHLRSRDYQSHQFTPLAEVRLRPELPRVGVEDDPLLARSFHDAVEPLDLPLNLVLSER